MDWIQFVIFFVTIGGLFLWSRTESRNDIRDSRADIRHLENKLESKIDNLINAIQTETKDFHGRLCGLEGKNESKKHEK